MPYSGTLSPQPLVQVASSSNGTTSGPPAVYGTSTSISRTASPSPLHPLNITTTQSSPDSHSFNSSAWGVAPPPSPSAGTVRSRKSASTTPTPSSPARVDLDVTRPSLKRLTADSAAKASVGTAEAGLAVDDVVGAARRSFDELSSINARQARQEREIIVHELAKTDTIASIALRYGITPQALRSSNRLWTSDSIHLRKTLNIPLDQCHLPSASTGIERIEREEDGNIVVWQRDPMPSSSSSSSLAVPSASAASLRPSASASSLRDQIVSPRARRLQAASAYELGSGTDFSGPEADLIGIWSGHGQTGWSHAELPDDPRNPPPPELRNGHGRHATSNGVHDLKGKGRMTIEDAGDDEYETLHHDAVASYLPSTNNPYSANSSPAPLLSFSPMPTPPSEPPDAIDRTFVDSPFSSSASTSSPGPGHPPPLQKRTLTISRVPNSQLSFFPPSASASGSNSSSARSSISTDESSGARNDGGFELFPKGSVFGPLADSLARLGSGGSSSPAKSRSSTPTGTLSSWAKKWDLSYFGGEEEDAARVHAAATASRRSRANGAATTGLSPGLGVGSGAIGLTEADGGTWGRKSAIRLPPSPDAGTPRRKTTTPPPPPKVPPKDLRNGRRATTDVRSVFQ